MQSIGFVFVTCADCGAEVDRIEYDKDKPAPAVEIVAAALGLSDADALKLVKRTNPGAERTSEQNARALAEATVAHDVDGRPAASYKCPNGHKAALVVSDDNPTPAVAVQITKG